MKDLRLNRFKLDIPSVAVMLNIHITASFRAHNLHLRCKNLTCSMFINCQCLYSESKVAPFGSICQGRLTFTDANFSFEEAVRPWWGWDPYFNADFALRHHSVI